MRRWWVVVAVIVGCGVDEGFGEPFAPDHVGASTSGAGSGDDATTSGATSAGPGGGSPGDASSNVSSISTSSAGSSDDSGSASGSDTDASSSGEVDLSCPDLGYEGACVDGILHWCEDDGLHTHDCAAEGEVCEWQSDDIGYNCLPMAGAFGYPVGDLVTPPAGGWTVTQVVGHYLGGYGGHLAQDIAAGEAATANAPVHSIGPGVVLYAGANASSYVNVVLVEHDLGAEGIVCSFYGHLGSVTVAEGQVVAQGEQIATVLDWDAYFGGANSHLHYVVLNAELCAASDAAAGALVCGYDYTAGPSGIESLDDEPYSYASIGDACGDSAYGDAFISPSQFIAAHQ